MPKTGLNEIIFIMDKSGSMASVASDAIGGFNQFLKEQRELPGEATMTYTQFDTDYEIKFSGKPLEDVQDLNEDTYQPSGWTALYDAVGRTIDEVGKRLAETPEEERPEKVILAVMTDGHENASTEYQHQGVADKLKHQQDKYEWEVFFLAANMDARKVGAALNVMATNSLNYESTRGGTREAYGNLSRRVRFCRTK
jgi:hypothetical protein